MPNPNTRNTSRDCEHGQLARSCNICELERALDEAYTSLYGISETTRISNEEMDTHKAIKSDLKSIELILLRKYERVGGLSSCEDEILRIVVAALRQFI